MRVYDMERTICDTIRAGHKCYNVLHGKGAQVKTKPIGIRFEQDEYDEVSAYARRNGISFSEAVRRGAVALACPDRAKGYRSLAQLARDGDADMALAFGQFLDDFSHASDKRALIEEEPQWEGEAGRWFYDFAATAHKLAHDNGLPVPQWALKDDYVSPEPLYAHGTENAEFQSYLRDTTPREFRWHNLFLGENILGRA